MCILPAMFVATISVLAMVSLDAFDTANWYLYMIYAFIESLLQTSVSAYGALYCGNYTFKILVPCFRISSRLFQEAVDSVDVAKLDVSPFGFLPLVVVFLFLNIFP